MRCQPHGDRDVARGSAADALNVKCKALPVAQLLQWNAKDPGTKCFWRRFGAAQPSPAVHNGACRGQPKVFGPAFIHHERSRE